MRDHMATAAVRGVFSALARSDTTTDATLLRRFTAGREEAAFAELVRRYGPLVLGVCRRVVADCHLAEDVFQAVFVVLARKAGTIDLTRPLGPWLYGVAYRVALRARTMIGRRRKRETLAESVPDVPHTPQATDDLSAVVDEEIAKLSVACREAVVLCELQGVSRRDAAKRLGIAEGTLSSRLAAARKTLAERLRKRGMAVGAGFVLPVVSSDLFAATVAVSTGRAALSPHLLTLVEGATRMALLNSIKLTVAAVVLTLTLGVIGLWRSAETNAAPVPRVEVDPGVVWLYNWQTGKLLAYRPNGDKLKEYDLPYQSRFHGLTPDGKRFVYAAEPGGKVPDKPNFFNGKLTYHTREVGMETPATDLGVLERLSDTILWSPDKTKFLLLRWGNGKATATVFDASGAEKKSIELEQPAMVDWTEDGKGLVVTTGYENGRPPKSVTVSRIALADQKTEKLFEVDAQRLERVSADGKWILGYDAKGLRRYDLASGKSVELHGIEERDYAHGIWSPDGQHVVFRWGKFHSTDGNVLNHDHHFVVCDRDGKGKVVIHQEPFSSSNGSISQQVIAWTPTPPDLKDAKPDTRKKNAPVPKAAPPEGVILAVKLSHQEPDKVIEVMDTAGKTQGHLKLGDLLNVQQARVSPDGKKLAFVRFIPLDSTQRGKYAYPQDVYVADLPLTGVPKEPVLKKVIEPTIAWAADGKTLFVSSIPDDTNLAQAALRGQMIPKKTVRYDLTAKTETAVKLPDYHAVQDVSPDGKTLLTRTKLWDRNEVAYSTYLVSLDTLKPKLVGNEDDGFDDARFSPDGSRIAGTRIAFTKSKDLGLFLADVATGKIEKVPLDKPVSEGLFNGSVVWAPDSKRLAVTWEAQVAGAPGVGGGGLGGGARAKRITVLDADGKNAKTIREFAPNDHVIRIEWADPRLQEAEKPDVRKKNSPVPKAEPPEGVIVLSSYGTDKPIEIVKSDGTAVKVLKPEGRWEPFELRSAPSGHGAVFATRADGPNRMKGYVRQSIGWLDLGANESKWKVLAEEAYDASVACPADVPAVIYSHIDLEKQGGQPKQADALLFETWRYDPASGKKTRLALPPEHAVLDVSADGKTLLTGTAEHLGPKRSLHVASANDLKPVKLLEAVGFDCMAPRLSPDGKRLLFVKLVDWPIKPVVGGPFILDVATGKATKVPLPDAEQFEDSLVSVQACWSPDGKRIALHWNLVDGKRSRDVAGRVTVFDTDGSNAKTILVRDRPGETITGLDWR